MEEKYKMLNVAKSRRIAELEAKIEYYEKSKTEMFSLLREQGEYIDFLHETLERRMNL